MSLQSSRIISPETVGFCSNAPASPVSQKQIRRFGGKDEVRMVAAYDPSWELVIILLKPQDRMSSYRVGIPEQRAKRTHC